VRGLLVQEGAHTGADELFVLGAGPTLDSKLRSLELIAEAWGATSLPSPVG
jgi:hypothetical protein